MALFEFTTIMDSCENDHYTRLENQQIGDNYILGKYICQNPSRSYVYHAYSQSSLKTNHYVAKIIPNYSYDQMPNNETDINQIFTHPSAMRYIDSFRWENCDVLIFPYCNKGDLIDYVTEHGQLNEEEAASLFYTIVSDISAMHNCQVVHLAVKPENILFHQEEDNTLNIYLDGFSHATHLSKGEMMSGIYGNILYNPPEALRGWPYDSSTDIWSLGITLFYAVEGYFPFNINEINVYHDSTFSVDNQLSRVSNQLKDLLLSMLAINPYNRPKANEILMHPWFDQSSKSKYQSVNTQTLEFGIETSSIQTQIIS